jgi:hypothetical protein
LVAVHSLYVNQAIIAPPTMLTIGPSSQVKANPRNPRKLMIESRPRSAPRPSTRPIAKAMVATGAGH